MRTSVSFFHLLEEAVRIIFQSKLLLTLTLPLGGILFVSTKISEQLTPLLPQDLSSPLFLPLLKEEQPLIFSLGATLVFLGIVHTILRGPLFLLIEERLLKQLPASPHQGALFNKKLLGRSALFSLSFETLYWGALLLIGAVISSPLFLAAKFNPSVIPSLFQIGTLLLLGLAIFFFYIKEFGLLYTLLAHIHPKLSLELGLKLFKKHSLLSLLFGLFLIALSFLFTFFLNLAMIISAFIPFSKMESLVNGVSGIVILGFITVLTETLRLLFFHALAATPRIKLTDMQPVLEKEKTTSGAPTA